MNLRPVIYITGILLAVLGLGMTIPLLEDLGTGNADWKVFFNSMMVTLFFAGMMIMTCAGADLNISRRQAFAVISSAWITLPAFAALPLWQADLGLSFTDAVFEAVSGLTTTGATVISGLDDAPKGILLWRAMLQWLGGIGVILMALSVMPFLKVGGMQIFRAELSESEKAVARALRLTGTIAIAYTALTALCVLFYHLAGLNAFDSLAYALTTISTGGFATHDDSFARFAGRNGPMMVAVIFMILGGFPFILYLKALRGKPYTLLRDQQIRWFLAIIAAVTVMMALWLTLAPGYRGLPGTSILHILFSVVSLITGTGFISTDYHLWGPFPTGLIFFLMAIGGCAGSTTGGIRIFRFQILSAIIGAQMKKLIHPSGIFIPEYDGKPVPVDIPVSVMGFFFLYALGFAAIATALAMTGLDPLTALSGAAASLSNVGPGLGEIIGPAGNFAPLPVAAKWILNAGMIAGRVEIFPVLVMMSPHFWRR